LQLALGEGYMTGQLRMERAQVYDLLTLLAGTQQRTAPSWTAGFDTARFLIRRVMQFNPVVPARRNVAHQYEIDGAIYDLFLDRDRQYSCVYSANGIADLHEEQLAKKRHVAAKLALGHLSSFRA
jgi:cyclopropane-fatty-acyl-phospholipid synthase